jgi:diacylglycerol kinase family enzyme
MDKKAQKLEVIISFLEEVKRQMVDQEMELSDAMQLQAVIHGGGDGTVGKRCLQ